MGSNPTRRTSLLPSVAGPVSEAGNRSEAANVGLNPTRWSIIEVLRGALVNIARLAKR